ncbi:hypothetical protein M427DRAFT_31688 [Gonapodya prolifera JEL478]|uniref:Mitochondrial outer membrane transport complex Sam37/metaxin N-terminal domain-containing protein n=1 Tax=Gonapodya prolifera (strain JEL478) TaxID=1344416 RepID=A0A139AHC0_GONPJ|nr:hypothetical protein M427DRAFT_31688 [Gonapodya prolifera JEL478]|eukprot:KXS16128.1 hypothetical protein M427DRAFT_31688 [Gonapodya prolifera JEL478]
MNLNNAVSAIHNTFRPLTDAWQSFTDRFPLHLAEEQFLPHPVPNTSDGVAELFLLPPRTDSADGLSFDVDCLLAQAYARMTSYPHVVRFTVNSDMSPNGRLPLLAAADGRLLAGKDVIDEIQSKSQHSEDTEELPFIALADLDLRVAFLHHFLLVPANSNHITSPWYDAHYASPISWILFYLEQRKARRWVEARKLDTEYIASTRSALASISTYITSRTPSSAPSLFDATLFAYLHHLLSTTAPDTHISKVVAGAGDVVTSIVSDPPSSG